MDPTTIPEVAMLTAAGVTNQEELMALTRMKIYAQPYRERQSYEEETV